MPSKSFSTGSVYASIDIETTGLNSKEDQILQVGIVLDDFECPVETLPQLELLVLNRYRRYSGSAFALQMNHIILEQISEIETKIRNGVSVQESYAWSHRLGQKVKDWLTSHGWNGSPLLCAGKNFASFDRRFLEQVPKWPRMHHRCLDPGSLYYLPDKDFDSPPSTETCCKRAKIDSGIKHTALADAIQVVKLIRRAYCK